MELLTCIFNIIWKPEKEGVANQFSEEQAQWILDHPLNQEMVHVNTEFISFAWRTKFLTRITIEERPPPPPHPKQPSFFKSHLQENTINQVL